MKITAVLTRGTLRRGRQVGTRPYSAWCLLLFSHSTLVLEFFVSLALVAL